MLITCESDEAGDLAGQYIDLADLAGPSPRLVQGRRRGRCPWAYPAGGRLLEVDFADNATATTIAAAIAAVLAGDAAFTPSTSAAGQVTAKGTNVGPVKYLTNNAPDAGTSDFTVIPWITGSTPFHAAPAAIRSPSSARSAFSPAAGAITTTTFTVP